MIPIGAIVVGIALAARYFEEKKSAGHDGKPVQSRRLFQGRSAAFLLVLLVVWPVWLFLLWANLFVEANLIAFVIALGLTPVCVPWPLVRAVAIPFGLPRVAWVFSFFADWTWGRDRRGGALLAAALAARRQVQRRSAAAAAGELAWVRTKLQKTELVGAAAVVAAAFVKDIDGDRAGADALLAVFPHFDPRVVPKTARHLVIERQMLHALADDDLAAIAQVGDAAVGLSLLGRFLRAACRRIVGIEARSLGSDLRLRALWLLTPRRRRALPLLRRALNSDTTVESVERERLRREASAAATTPTTATTTAASPLPLALTLHVAATQKTPTLAEVSALATAWDPALKEACCDLSARARVLGVHDVDGVVRGVEETVTEALASLVATLDLSTVNVASLPPLLQRALDDVRSRRLDALEIAASGLRHRAESTTDLAPIDELREFAAVKELADEVIRSGDDGRALAYDAIHWTLCEIAVRLWNVRAEHRLGNAMFRWLLSEATALEDTRGVETQTANVKCGP